MALKVLKDIPSGRNQLVVGFYRGHCQGEQIFHIKCKLHAGHSNCLLRSREQDTEVPPRTAFRFLASADTRKHPRGQTITQGRELPLGSRQTVWGVQSLPGALELGLYILPSPFTFSVMISGQAPTRAEASVKMLSQSAACV